MLVLSLFGLVASYAQGRASGASSDVDVRVATTVSIDGGQTWQADACAPSGTTVQIQNRAWNTGTDTVYKVEGTVETANGSYLRDCTTNGNSDGDNYGYTGDAVNGEFQANHLEGNGNNTTAYQGEITTCRIEAPCEALITGTVVLVRANTDNGEPVDRQGFIGRALAAITTVSQSSGYTIRVAGGTCPRTCGSSTTTSLPQTGSSIIDLVNNLF
jgi:hypothetical protein